MNEEFFKPWISVPNKICDNPTLFFHLWKSVDKGMLNNYNYGGQILLDS